MIQSIGVTNAFRTGNEEVIAAHDVNFVAEPGESAFILIHSGSTRFAFQELLVHPVRSGAGSTNEQDTRHPGLIHYILWIFGRVRRNLVTTIESFYLKNRKGNSGTPAGKV